MHESLTRIVSSIISLNCHHIRIGLDEDGNERLIIDGQPVGRCFKLYGFMEEVVGVRAVLADFADILMIIMMRYPQTFENVREDIEGLAEYFEPELRDDWVALWKRESETSLEENVQ
jgi:hypothetical protein